MINKEGSLYHRAYPFAQKMNILGSWRLTEDEHITAINKSVTTPEPTVLYCGTATSRNPLDAENVLMEQGYNPRIITVDLSSYPLKHMPKNLSRVQASAAKLPFQNESFDVITTDFLTNMVNLEEIREIAKEWSRILKPKGVITTNSYFRNTSLGVESLYQRLLYGIGVKSFYSQEALDIALQAEGLHTEFSSYTFQKKPHLYPSSPVHLTVVPFLEDEREEKISKAQQIWEQAQEISSITTKDLNLAPRTMSETISDIVKGNYVIDQDEQKIRAFGRTSKLTDDWVEVGTIYVQPDLRNQGVGKSIVSRLIESNIDQNMVTFSNNPAMIHLLKNESFIQSQMKNLPLDVIKHIRDDRLRTVPRMITATKALIENKQILVRAISNKFEPHFREQDIEKTSSKTI